MHPERKNLLFCNHQSRPLHFPKTFKTKVLENNYVHLRPEKNRLTNLMPKNRDLIEFEATFKYYEKIYLNFLFGFSTG